jgi:hypothetical protein
MRLSRMLLKRPFKNWWLLTVKFGKKLKILGSFKINMFHKKQLRFLN